MYGGYSLNKNNSLSRPIDIVKDLAKRTAEKLGLILWDVKFVKEGSIWYLRIFIDKDTGVTIEDCEKMSKALDSPLDELDPIEMSYCLEVCSPGIERELSTDEHISQYLNNDVTITLVRKDTLGNKKISTKLQNFDKENIYVENIHGQIEKVPRKNIAHIKLSADSLQQKTNISKEN